MGCNRNWSWTNPMEISSSYFEPDTRRDEDSVTHLRIDLIGKCTTISVKILFRAWLHQFHALKKPGSSKKNWRPCILLLCGTVATRSFFNSKTTRKDLDVILTIPFIILLVCGFMKIVAQVLFMILFIILFVVLGKAATYGAWIFFYCYCLSFTALPPSSNIKHFGFS